MVEKIELGKDVPAVRGAASPEVARGRTKVELGTEPPAVSETQREGILSRVGRLSRDLQAALAEGSSLFLSDELAGLAAATAEGILKPFGRSTRTLGEAFAEGTEAERQRLEEIPPSVRIPANIAGGVMTGGGVAGSFPQTASTVPRMVATGTVEGVVAGAGAAEGGPQERAVGAGIGGATGATLGLVLPVVARGAGTLITKIRNSRAFQGLEKNAKFAIDRVLRELRRGGITAQQAAARVEKLGGQGVLADVPELRALARDVAGTKPAGGIAEDVLERRAAGARDRISGAIQEITGAEDFATFRAGLLRGREEAAGDLFDQARAFGVLEETPALRALVGTVKGNKRVGGSSLIRPAIARIKAKNPELALLDDLDMRVLDAVYKDLPFTPGGKGFQATSVRNQFKEAIADQVPVYAEALDTFSGSKALEEAMEQGRKILRADDFLTVESIRGMTSGEREAFLVGAVRAVQEEALKGAPVGIANRIFSARNRPKIAAAFGGDQQALKAFRLELLREIEFAKSARVQSPFRGSPTQPKQAGAEDLLDEAGRIARASERLRQSQVLGAGLELVRGRGGAPRLTEGQSRALAQLLFRSRTEPATLAPTPLQNLLLQELLPPPQASRLLSVLAPATPAGGLAGLEGGNRLGLR